MSYLGPASIEQAGRKSDMSAVLYALGESPATRFIGRYFGLAEPFNVEPGAAFIQFSDGSYADATVVHAAPDSGQFEISGYLGSYD